MNKVQADLMPKQSRADEIEHELDVAAGKLAKGESRQRYYVMRLTKERATLLGPKSTRKATSSDKTPLRA